MAHPIVKEIADRIANARWQKAGAVPGALEAIRAVVLKEIEVPIYGTRLFDKGGNDKGITNNKLTLSDALIAAEKWERGEDKRCFVTNCSIPGGHDVRFMLQGYEFYEERGMLGTRNKQNQGEVDAPPDMMFNLNNEEEDVGGDGNQH